MAARRIHSGDQMGKVRSPGAAWTKPTWSDLEGWSGKRSVTRGRSYQRGGRVRDLMIAGDGPVLLATVLGGDRYAVTVALDPGGRRPSLKSTCTCPVGLRCKHA